MEDRQLHERLVSGDHTALTEIYHEHAPTLFRVALRVTGDRQSAEDVTQETLLKLWRQPESYQPDRGGLRPWLATNAHNRAVDWVRRQEAARSRDLRLIPGPIPDIGEEVQVVMTAERVRTALRALPEPEQVAIRLAYLGERSYRQVALDLKLPEGTIKSRIRSGLKRLSLSMTAEIAASR